VIRHIVFFAAAPENRDLVVAGLQLLEEIPDAQRVEVRVNQKWDTWSQEIDVVVYAEFESKDQLTAFKSHPLYAESITRVRPNRTLRYVADIEV
jgi:hypothetical protein